MEDKFDLSLLSGQWISGQDNVYKRLNPTLIFRIWLPDTAFKDCRYYTTDLLSFQKDQAKNLNEEELVFSGSIPL